VYHVGVNALRRAFDFFLDILFPQDEDVRHLETMTAGGLASSARRLEPGRDIEDSVILFEYKDPLVRLALAEAKFRGNRRIARLLGEAARDALAAELYERKTFENFSSPILVAVPMTKRSLRERGHDQCRLICEPIREDAESLGLSIRFDALEKVRETGDQVGRDKRERLESLKGSLKADPEIVRGKNIVVFDDIVTTGATWAEAKRALRKAGARRVLLLAIAH
ncbi:MAG: phosphoribosyltransferase family protein, partial [Candidatus Paceibacterota bacterium]